MTRRFFITGTDTDAGKTLTSGTVLQAAVQAGFSAFGLKPVAAGCDQQADGALVNDDALLHQQCSAPSHVYAVHNPIALKAAIAPHIAAEQEGRPMTLQQLVDVCLDSLHQAPADVQLVEGAGGWLVPINEEHTLADLAVALNEQTDEPRLEVILVVGLRLGCINHAMLTLESIQHRGLKVAGWVANSLSPSMEVEDANFRYLHQAFEHAGVPCVGQIPWQPALAGKQGMDSLPGKIQTARSLAGNISLFR